MAVGVDLLGKLGFAVADATSDWGTLPQRRANKSLIDHGGWNVMIALFSATEFSTPAGNVLLRGKGNDAWFGWPTSPGLEALREAWFDAPDLTAQKQIATSIQEQFFRDLPYIELVAKGRRLPIETARFTLFDPSSFSFIAGEPSAPAAVAAVKGFQAWYLAHGDEILADHHLTDEQIDTFVDRRFFQDGEYSVY